MATAKAAVKELTECSICGGSFTRPKALPCQHCFCQECLESWLASSRGDKKNITCPQCRKRHAVPESGIVGFPGHYLMNNLLDIAGQGEESCADCEEQADIIKTCPHCQQRICADCLIAHAVIKATDQEGEGRSDSAVTSKPPAATSKQSAVTSKSSAATSKLSALTSKLPDVTSKRSAVTSKLSALTSKLPDVTSKRSAVTSKLSAVTSKLSTVTSKLSAVTSQFSAGSSRTLADRQTFSQNQLPRNVDYRAMRGRSVTVNRLSCPRGCAHHVARREVYVAEMRNDRVMVYDRDGSNGRVFYTELEYSPRDVAVSTDGQFVYIVTTNALIKTNMNGKRVKTIKTFSRGEWKWCTSVHCYRKFTLVVDAENRCVVVFDKADNEIRCFGQDQLKRPAHLAVSEDGQVHVTDEEGSCVHVFSWEGAYLRSFGATGEDRDIGGITVDGDGNVCVARFDSRRIDVFDRQRNVITTIGREGYKSINRLQGPDGLCLTPDGCLVVAEWGNNRVQIFGREREDH